MTSNGMFRATALVAGRVMGMWSLPGGRVTLTTLQPLAPAVRDQLAAETDGVLRFLDLPPAPLVVAIRS